MTEEKKDCPAGQENPAQPLIKISLEFGPLLLFLVVFWAYGIFTATKVFMVAVLVALVASRMILGRVAIMPIVVAGFVMFFGGLTIWLDNDVFIKLKPTIVNLLFAIVLLGGLMTGRPLLKYVFEEAFDLTEKGWLVMTRRWAFFFLFLAALNEIIWRNFSTGTWVTFKTFGIITLTMIFAAAQIGLIHQHGKPSADRTGKE